MSLQREPHDDECNPPSVANVNCRIGTINVINKSKDNVSPPPYSRHSKFVEFAKNQKKAAKFGISLHDHGQPNVFRHNGKTRGYCQQSGNSHGYNQDRNDRGQPEKS